MKPYSLNLKVWKEDDSSDLKTKGKAYRSFKKSLRSFWKRKLKLLK